MEETSLDPDVVPDAEPDASTLDAGGGVLSIEEHPGNAIGYGGEFS